MCSEPTAWRPLTARRGCIWGVWSNLGLLSEGYPFPGGRDPCGGLIRSVGLVFGVFDRPLLMFVPKSAHAYYINEQIICRFLWCSQGLEVCYYSGRSRRTDKAVPGPVMAWRDPIRQHASGSRPQ